MSPSSRRSLPTPSGVLVERCPELDSIDPQDAAARLRDLPALALLEFGARHGSGERRSGWTFVTADPLAVEELRSPEPDPFRRSRELLSRMDAAVVDVPGAPPWTGGLAGYLAYDLGRSLERLPEHAVDDQRLPALRLALYDWVVARDWRTGATWLASRAVDGDLDRMVGRREEVMRRLRNDAGKVPSPQAKAPIPRLEFVTNLERPAYVAAIERVRLEISKGELYQANLARRIQAPFDDDPWPLYRRLALRDPVSNGAFLDLGRDAAGRRRALLSASPERFLTLSSGGRAASDPIKGTRPRSPDPAADRDLRRELLASAKDRAENVMIVDVLRNDFGRVCVPGSVTVPRLCRLERTRTVQHLVSRVEGRLRHGCDAFDLLVAAFPGASITGAPKIRAMELIDELEPVRRGPYTGSAVWIGADGAMDSSILIRTLVADGRRLTLHVGGGITWRSDADAEWDETVAKARGPLAALDAAGA